MTYNLYSDKPNKFSCNIDVEGTSLSNSKVRLVIETEEMTYLFNGNIENTGVCEVNVPKTKNFLPEGTKGNMKLEVIADDVYFEPWSSDFNVKTSKKVSVTVAEQVEEKPKMKVTISEQPQEIQKPKIVEKKFNLPQGKKSVVMTKEQIRKMLNGL